MLVVHTGNASCPVLSFCFVRPAGADSRVASPEAPERPAASPPPCPGAFRDRLVALRGSLPTDPVARCLSGGFTAGLDRAVSLGLSAGSKEDAVVRRPRLFFQENPSAFGH